MKRLLLLLLLAGLLLGSCEKKENLKFQPGDLVVHKFTGDTLIVRSVWGHQSVKTMDKDYDTMIFDNKELYEIKPPLADTVLWDRLKAYRKGAS